MVNINWDRCSKKYRKTEREHVRGPGRQLANGEVTPAIKLDSLAARAAAEMKAWRKTLTWTHRESIPSEHCGDRVQKARKASGYPKRKKGKKRKAAPKDYQRVRAECKAYSGPPPWEL